MARPLGLPPSSVTVGLYSLASPPMWPKVLLEPRCCRAVPLRCSGGAAWGLMLGGCAGVQLMAPDLVRCTCFGGKIGDPAKRNPAALACKLPSVSRGAEAIIVIGRQQ